jgi:hypothetical protein
MVSQALAESFGTSGPSMVPNSAGDLSGSFSPSPTAQFSGNFDGASFLQAGASLIPNCPIGMATHSLKAYPEGTSYGSQPGANLLIQELVFSTQDTGPLALDHAYGNPFPTGWEIVSELSASICTDASGKAALKMTSTAALDTSGNLQLAPTLGFPTGAQVNGTPLVLSGPISGVGLTPALSWTAPSLGSVSQYRVVIESFNDNSMWTIRTTGTSVEVPPGILQSGTTYGVGVQAVSYGAPPAVNGPLYESIPMAKAGALAGAITP